MDLFHALSCFLALSVENLRCGPAQIVGSNQEESIFPMFVTTENVGMLTKIIRIIKKETLCLHRKKEMK